MSTVHTIALEYIVAIYPLVLTVVIYLCIDMAEELGWWFVCGGHSMCVLLVSEEGGIPRGW